MRFMGDLAFLIGTIGIVIYLCLIVIRFTTQSARAKAGLKQYRDQIESLRQRIAELKEQRDAATPEVDELVSQVISLREVRDRLYYQFEDMVAKSKERDISIKYNRH